VAKSPPRLLTSAHEHVNHRPASWLLKPDKQRLWHRRFISGRVDLDRRALSSGAYLRMTSRFPESDRNRKPPASHGGSSFTAAVSLPADLDTAWRYATTTGSAGTSAPTVRDQLHPKGAFALVVRGAVGAAQCIQAGLCRARGCAGVSR